MKDIIIGIDGGGTATKAAALDISGRLVARSAAGSMNYNFMPMENCVSNVCGAIRKLMLGDRCHIVACAVGDPSIDDEVKYAPSERFINELRDRAGFGKDMPILLKSDVFMCLYGLTEGEPGVLVIAGTGSMGMAINERGDTMTVGGWGNPCADKGSGYDIAVKALSAVFDEADKTGPPTLLTEKSLEFYEVAKPRELIGIFNGGGSGRPDIAAFAPVVSACAEMGDKTALGIIAQAADDLAGYALSLLRRMKKKCRVGIYGGVFSNNAAIRMRFGQTVSRHFPETDIGFPETLPEIAAARYALHQLRPKTNSYGF